MKIMMYAVALAIAPITPAMAAGDPTCCIVNTGDTVNTGNSRGSGFYHNEYDNINGGNFSNTNGSTNSDNSSASSNSSNGPQRILVVTKCHRKIITKRHHKRRC